MLVAWQVFVAQGEVLVIQEVPAVQEALVYKEMLVCCEVVWSEPLKLDT